MRRAAFLLLTGLTAPALRALTLADQLPFATVDEGWADYSEGDVFLTCLMREIAPQFGNEGAASRAALFPRGDLVRHAPAIFAGEADVWAACFEPRTGPNDPRPVRAEFAWSVAPLRALLTAPSTTGEPLESYGQAMRSFTCINVSKVIRDIARRAHAAGLDFSADFLGSPPLDLAEDPAARLRGDA